MNVERDPAEAGFDARRLARIDSHYARYVDDGKLPGFLAVIARDGAIVHVARAGLRDVEAGLPVEPDTLWRIYSMTKPVTAVAAMMLWEEGAFELKDPVSRAHRELRRRARVERRKPEQASDRARGGAGADLASADPHVGADVRLSLRGPGGRDLPRARLRVGRAARCRPRRRLRRVGRDAAALPARQRVELLRLDRRARPRRRGRVRAAARRVLPGAHLRPARDDRHRLRRVRPGPARRPLRAGPEAQRPHGRRGAAPAGSAVRRRRARVHRGRLPPLHAACCSRTARRCSGPVRCATWPATTCPAVPS